MAIHELDSELLRSRISVTVVGCGGTGSSIAMMLPYLHQAMIAKGCAGLRVRLVDGDIISETNCVRQPFSRGEIGMHKATVLAGRINLFHNLAWTSWGGYVTGPEFNWEGADIIIGCVDTRSARKTLHESLTQKNRHVAYWLDIGNTSETGQFVLGQPHNACNPRKAMRLPTVAELYPEILDFAGDEDSGPSCSAIEALTRQQPFVNQVLATQAMSLLTRLLWHGQIEHHGAFVNLANGRSTPLPVDKAHWQKVMRMNRKVAA